MYAEINRRQFLRGDLRGEHVPLRPPWSRPESEFLSTCSACGECVSNCPEGILINGSGNYPEIDFQRGECTFCGECVRQCRDGALTDVVGNQKKQPWFIRASVGNECLVWKNVLCQTCGEQCEQNAITFRFVAGGLSHPELDVENCNGCGACYAACPAHAITLRTL